MKKRGQFYLVAALVIIGIVAGLAATYNMAVVPKTFVKQEYLIKEIEYEINQLITHGLNNGLPQTETNDKIQDLATYYAQANPDTYFLFITTDDSTIQLYSYNNDQTDQVTVSHANQEYASTAQEETATFTLASPNEVTVTLINGKSFTRTLKETDTKIFMKREGGDEIFIKFTE